jgi:uncharacterized membrane protein (UPF0127 family)
MLGMCATLGLDACSARASGSFVEIKGHRFQVEIAADEASRERGLMFRENMPSGHGMLFVFDDAQVRTFWMKNTPLPLDILYFDQNYKLVSVQRRVPSCLSSSSNCPVYPSEGAAQYVLELNAGTADKLGVKPGDTLVVHR